MHNFLIIISFVPITLIEKNFICQFKNVRRGCRILESCVKGCAERLRTRPQTPPTWPCFSHLHPRQGLCREEGLGAELSPWSLGVFILIMLLDPRRVSFVHP